MYIVGIVAEYNPFHRGHQYHIEKAKTETAADGVVAVMSGNFVQRGEPAVFDKWTRALHALKGGVDLVLELPALYATSSAETFARGAVQTLEGTGVVDVLSFGSECGDIDILRRAAKILEEEPPAFKAVLQEKLRGGGTYAAAQTDAMEAVDREAARALCTPNNLLGISYLRAMGGNMAAHTIKRKGAGYLEKEMVGEFPSAMAIRERLNTGEPIDAFVPYSAENLLVHQMKMYEDFVLYALRTNDWQEYGSIPDNIKKRMAGCKMGDLDAWLEKVKTKNITMAAVKRAMLQILLQNALSPARPPSYIRVLGFTKRGAEILKEMKKTAQLPVITRPAAFTEKCPIWELDRRATDIYFLPERRFAEDIRRAPVQI